jgi:hypothetical protein
MSKIDDGYAECEREAFWDGLERHWAAMRSEIDLGSDWSEAQRAEIEESIRWNDYMDLWGDLDPTASGFKNRRREGV